MEERMTVCNMSIEAGARAGMIAPDETTYRLSRGRPRAPQGAAWERALERWRALPSDAGRALRPRGRRSMAAAIEPMITYGTNPGMVMPVSRLDSAAARRSGVRQGARLHGPSRRRSRSAISRSTSCSSAAAPMARLSDLRSAAQLLRGRKIARGVRALVVPGSQQVKNARPRPRGSTASSSTPAPSGASRAARCASA